jgi:acyl-CoA thioesterase-1
MRVLVFGASITQGFYDMEGGWVQRLRKYYDQLSFKDPSQEEVTVFNLGISGDSTDRLLMRFENETKARKFPGEEFAFIFSVGTNNAWVEENGKQNSTPEEYVKDLEELISKARQYSDKVLFVGIAPCIEQGSTPVPWADIYFTNKRLFIFEQKLREVCDKNNIPQIAIFEVIKDELDKGAKLYADGLHPNNKGHELIFQLVRPVLDEVLSEGRGSHS